MATTRSVTRQIRDLQAPQMGNALPMTGSNPSGFNDLANNMAAIDHAGITVAHANATCTGGLYRPVIGDYGNSFTHHLPMSVTYRIEIPNGYNRYQLTAHLKSISPTHYLTARLERDVNGFTFNQYLIDHQSTVQLGGGSKTRMYSGALTSNHIVTGGYIDELRLILESDKSAIGGTAASSTTTYWDGILTFQLKFYKQ